MAIKTNLVIDQGADFSVTINVTNANNVPLSLDGFSARAQMRKYFTSSRFYEFNVAVAHGTVTLTMNSHTTNTITPGRYMFDCELVSESNTVSRIVEGISTVTPGVTR